VPEIRIVIPRSAREESWEKRLDMKKKSKEGGKLDKIEAE
jgi:hypothetical protein